MKKLTVGAFIFGWLVIPVFWYRLFFFKGLLPGPPKIIRNFVVRDGEGGYDLIFYDMYLSITIVLLVLAGFLLFKAKRKKV